MPRFFICASQIETEDGGAQTVRILGDDAHHITKSLRMREGDSITVCDMARTEYICQILSVGECVLARVESAHSSVSEPPYEAVLYQALIKGDKFDHVVQKAVECGVYRIVPVLTERCVVRLDKKDGEKKRLRWQRIAAEAAKQCGRGIIPEVSGLMYFKEAVSQAAQTECPLFCYEGEVGRSLAQAVRGCRTPGTVSLMIGSEGGFSLEEAAYATECGMCSVGLGRRILRTETASSFALACLSFAYEMEQTDGEKGLSIKNPQKN